MADPQSNLERFKEIKRRGLQDRLNGDLRARFDEAERRGMLGGEIKTDKAKQVLQGNPITEGKSVADFIPSEKERNLRKFNEADTFFETTSALGDALLSGASDIAADTAKSFLEVAQVEGNVLGRAVVKALSGNNPLTTMTPEEESVLPEQISNMLKMEPFTPEGKAVKSMIGDKLLDVAKTLNLDDAANFLSEQVSSFENHIQKEYGVSEMTAQGLTALPLVMLEVLPVTKAAKLPKKLRGTGAMNDASIYHFVDTPDRLAQVKKARDLMYEDLKGSGAGLRQGTISKVIRDVEQELLKSGVDLKATGIESKLKAQRARLKGKLITDVESVDRGKFRGSVGTPKSMRGDRFSSKKVIELGKKPKTEHFIDIENLKQSLYKNSNRSDSKEMYAVHKAGRVIDSFLDNNMQDYVITPKGKSPRDVSKTVRAARDLGGRVARADDLNDLWYRASNMDTPASQMKTLRSGVRDILKDRKYVNRTYSPEQRDLMEKIARNKLPDDVAFLRMLGGFTGKALPVTARFVKHYSGKFRHTNIVERANYFSKSLLQNTERTGDAFVALQRRVLLGKDANSAINRYFKEVPIHQRTPEELGIILSGGDFDLNVPIERVNKLKKEALQIARGKQILDSTLRASVLENSNEEEENAPIY